ncbi:MAG: GntR family transcriptional regulator [Bacillota bacterium]
MPTVSLIRLPLYEQIYRVLKSQIAAGELPPGSPISDYEVATRLSVSRTPAREAIKRLVQEGLIQVHPNRRLSVVQPTAREMAETYAMRAALEGLAAGMAAQNPMRRHLLADAQAALDEVTSDVNQMTPSRWGQVNSLFHDAIIRVAGCEPLERMLDSMRIKITLCRASALSKVRQFELAWDEHREILGLVLDGKATDAERKMRAHIVSAGERVIKAVFGHASEFAAANNWMLDD